MGSAARQGGFIYGWCGCLGIIAGEGFICGRGVLIAGEIYLAPGVSCVDTDHWSLPLITLLLAPADSLRPLSRCGSA